METQRQNKILYNVRLDKQPLENLQIIAQVEGDTTSNLIRRSISTFVSKWNRKRKAEILQEQQDFQVVKGGQNNNHPGDWIFPDF